MRSIIFENIIRKHFGSTNKQIVEMAIEDHEVSFNNLSVYDFNLKDRKIVHEAAVIVYTGKLGYNVLKFAPRNIALKVITPRLG